MRGKCYSALSGTLPRIVYHFKNGVTKGNGSPFNASVAVGFRAEAFIGITGISASL